MACINMESLVLNCVRLRFDFNDSNVANGVAPVHASLVKRRVNDPFCRNDAIQYLPVDKASFNSLESMVKSVDSEPSKRRLMLSISQILLKTSYFIDKRRLPSIIYVYDYGEHYYYVKQICSPKNLKCLNRLPKAAKIEDNYVIDAKTARKLDKMANILHKISLNHAIYSLFNDFLSARVCCSKKNVFSLLHDALLERQKTAKYKPNKVFLDNLVLLAREYSAAKNYKHKLTKAKSCFTNIACLKRMEFFLLLSQNFGYRIPQRLKTSFQNKVNTVINAIRLVFSSYSRLINGDSLEHMMILDNIAPFETAISRIAEYVCDTPATPVSEILQSPAYSCEMFPICFSNEFIVSDQFTIIGYKCKSMNVKLINLTNKHCNYALYCDNRFSCEKVKNLCERLRPIVSDGAKYSLFCNNAMKDPDFPLFERAEFVDGYDAYYYEKHGYYSIFPENSLCYLNLAKVFDKIAGSDYPYEFTRQALIAKLPEIMPFISTAFCDIPEIC